MDFFEEFKSASEKNDWGKYFLSGAVDFHFSVDSYSNKFTSSIIYPIYFDSKDTLLILRYTNNLPSEPFFLPGSKELTMLSKSLTLDGLTLDKILNKLNIIS